MQQFIEKLGSGRRLSRRLGSGDSIRYALHVLIPARLDPVLTEVKTTKLMKERLHT